MVNFAIPLAPYFEVIMKNILRKNRQEQINKLTDVLKNSYSFWETAPIGTSCSLFEFKAEYLYEQGYRHRLDVLQAFVEFTKDKLFSDEQIAMVTAKDFDKLMTDFLEAESSK